MTNFTNRDAEPRKTQLTECQNHQLLTTHTELESTPLPSRTGPLVDALISYGSTLDANHIQLQFVLQNYNVYQHIYTDGGNTEQTGIFQGLQFEHSDTTDDCIHRIKFLI
jgi:hypothetical protein